MDRSRIARTFARLSQKGRSNSKKGGSVGNGRFTVPLRYVYVYGRNYITIRYVTVFAALYA